MAKSAKKPKSTWRCRDCDTTTSGWFGRCPSCGAWNTIEEDTGPATTSDGSRIVLKASDPVAATAHLTPTARIQCGIRELDRVLGGGLVAGSAVLLGGPPGIGKSTLLLQASAGFAGTGPVLYASGEESVGQVAGRARRLGVSADDLLLLAETRIEPILDAARGRDLSALVVDSVQTVFSEGQDGLPGNVTQIRAVANHLIGFAKSTGVPVICVGHVTKEGALAGPRLLEHMVDVVLSFEGEEDRVTRLLRATKNRFGNTAELGVFEMGGEGLIPVDNPSESFLSADRNVPGACVTASLEGSRPLLLEVQALLTPGLGGSPRRNCVGVDANRVAMLLAVLDRHGGVSALDHDVFVNIAGGLRLREPAADLAVLMAVASSHLRRALPVDTLVFGEVGLTGELRPVPRAEARLAEAARLGFRQAIAPAGKKLRVPKGLSLTRVGTVAQALEAGLS